MDRRHLLTGKNPTKISRPSRQSLAYESKPGYNTGVAMMLEPFNCQTFIDRWRNAEASERANAVQFLIELADLLGVSRPSNTYPDGYSFDFPVKIPKHDGSLG